MDRTAAVRRPVVAVLREFRRTSLALRHPTLATRSVEVLSRLVDYLDAEASRFLTTGELEAVAAERRAVRAGRAAAHGVVARVTDAEALLCALPGFLEPRWLPGPYADAKAQVLVVEELVRWLRRSGDPDPRDHACGYLAAEVQARRARESLRRPARSGLRLVPVAG